MEYGITLSIRQFLASFMPEAKEVVLMRDGVVLSGRAKPFLSVQNLGDINESIAAGRRSYEETYRFQVGVHANNIGELLRLKDKTKTLLRRPDGIELYDDKAVATGLRFNVDVEGFTPIYSDDTANETENHRGYFDISVTVYLNTGDTEFSQ